jgi:hypothetical protein
MDKKNSTMKKINLEYDLDDDEIEDILDEESHENDPYWQELYGNQSTRNRNSDSSQCGKYGYRNDFWGRYGKDIWD